MLCIIRHELFTSTNKIVYMRYLMKLQSGILHVFSPWLGSFSPGQPSAVDSSLSLCRGACATSEEPVAVTFHHEEEGRTKQDVCQGGKIAWIKSVTMQLPYFNSYQGVSMQYLLNITAQGFLESLVIIIYVYSDNIERETLFKERYLPACLPAYMYLLLHEGFCQRYLGTGGKERG